MMSLELKNCTHASSAKILLFSEFVWVHWRSALAFHKIDSYFSFIILNLSRIFIHFVIVWWALAKPFLTIKWTYPVSSVAWQNEPATIAFWNGAALGTLWLILELSSCCCCKSEGCVKVCYRPCGAAPTLGRLSLRVTGEMPLSSRSGPECAMFSSGEGSAGGHQSLGSRGRDHLAPSSASTFDHSSEWSVWLWLCSRDCIVDCALRYGELLPSPVLLDRLGDGENTVIFPPISMLRV